MERRKLDIYFSLYARSLLSADSFRSFSAQRTHIRWFLKILLDYGENLINEPEHEKRHGPTVQSNKNHCTCPSQPCSFSLTSPPYHFTSNGAINQSNTRTVYSGVHRQEFRERFDKLIDINVRDATPSLRQSNGFNEFSDRLKDHMIHFLWIYKAATSWIFIFLLRYNDKNYFLCHPNLQCAARDEAHFRETLECRSFSLFDFSRDPLGRQRGSSSCSNAGENQELFNILLFLIESRVQRGYIAYVNRHTLSVYVYNASWGHAMARRRRDYMHYTQTASYNAHATVRTQLFTVQKSNSSSRETCTGTHYKPWQKFRLFREIQNALDFLWTSSILYITEGLRTRASLQAPEGSPTLGYVALLPPMTLEVTPTPDEAASKAANGRSFSMSTEGKSRVGRRAEENAQFRLGVGPADNDIHNYTRTEASEASKRDFFDPK
uniref:Uncharacterized protein n=1 Tax=Trichogramma kaykai TaxID=54128 RepID=A0ABD2XFT5_9HYME